MSDKQFIFSLLVGGLLVVLGGLLTTQASIGFGLLGLGVTISVLAVFTRNADKASDGSLVPISLENGQ